MKRQNKRIPTLALALVLLLSTISPAFAADAAFPDIRGHWAEETINELAGTGVVHGYDDGLCHPDDLLSWGQCVMLVQRFFQQDAAGYIKDTGPGDPITRMNMVRVMLRVLNKAPKEQKNTPFKDDESIRDGDKGYLNLANELGIIQGYVDGTVRPYQDVTRAEGFVMLKRLTAVYEELKKQAETENKPSISIGSGGGSVTKPAEPETKPTIQFTLPEVIHAGSAVPVDVAAEHTNGAPAVWNVKRDGNEMPAADVVNAAGDLLQFTEPGIYEITAIVKDDAGKEASCTQAIRVIPIADIAFALPKTTHVGDAVEVSVSGKYLDGLPVTWSAAKDGNEINLSDYITGELSDSGGTIRFTTPGTYTLTAAVTDELGRTDTETNRTTVYPVGAVGFFLPSFFHTDDTVLVEAAIMELADNPLTWNLTRNGEAVELSEYVVGDLTETGGTIQVTQKGEYVLSAAFTDEAGETYHYEQSFKVYPIPAVEFSIRDTAWTDTKITVSVAGTDTEDVRVEWLVDNTYGYQDWATYVDGRLTNDGGTIRFKRAGTYELVARMTDATGRVFLFEQDAICEVQPVLRIAIIMPDLFRVDKSVDIRTSGNNTLLPGEWTLTRDGQTVDLAEQFSGRLNNFGGKGTFLTHGNYVLTASMTDVLGRTFSADFTFLVYPIATYAVSMPETCHIGTPFTVTGSGDYLDGCSIVWELTKDGEHAEYVGELGNDGGEIVILATGNYTLTATVTDRYGNVCTAEDSIEITNTAPETPTIAIDLDYNDTINTYTPECQIKAGITPNSSDVDGDAVEFEYDTASAQTGYFGVGEHTVRVRAVDQWGLASEWAEQTFTVSSDEPDVDLYCTVLGSNDGTNIEDLDFDLEISRSGPNQIFVADYHNPAHSESISTLSLNEDNSIVHGHYAFGRHILLVKVVDIFGNTAYGARAFIIGDDANNDKTSITSLSTVITEEGLYNGTDLLAYIGGFTFNVPSISGHSSSHKDIVEIFGVTEDGTEELVLAFNTNNGYVYAHSGGRYEYTQKGSNVETGEWSGWEKQKYTKMIFHYEMPTGHESCVSNATEGLSYRVRYSFIPEQIERIEALFR